MPSLIGALRISLGLETAAFETGAKRSSAQMDRLGSNAEKMGFAVGRATKNLIALGSVLVGSAVAGGMLAAVKSSLEFASSLGETAQQIGVTVRELQVYRYAASQAGIAEEEMDGALSKLTKSLGQAALGGKAQAAVFTALGISLRDASGHVKTAGTVLPEIAEALSKIPDPAQRAAAEVAIFGRTGQKLDTILTGGKKGIAEYAKAADDAGMIISDELADAADTAADRIDHLNRQLKVNFTKEVAANADAILTLANALATLTIRSIQFISKHPQLVGALAGAAVGSRVAGVPGAAVGAGVGAVGGASAARGADDANMDLRHRTARLQQATRDANTAMAASRQPRTAMQRMGITPDWNTHRGDRSYDAVKAELHKQQGLMAEAQRAARAADAEDRARKAAEAQTQIDLPDFLASEKKGKKGKSAEAQAREDERAREEAIRRQKGFDDDMARLDADLLDAKRDQAADYQQIAAFARQEAEADYDKSLLDIKAKRDLGDLTELQAVQLAAKAKEVELQRMVVINAEEAARQAADAQALLTAQYENQRDLLASQQQLALTATDRKAVMLRLLDLDKQEERARLEAVIASKQATEVEKTIARERLKQLDAIYQGRGEVIKDQNRSPLDEYAKRKARTPEQMQERAEQLVVDRLDSVEQGISQALAEKLGMGDDPLVTGLIEMLLDEILFRPLAEALRGGPDGMSGGGMFGGGGLFGGILSGVGKIFGFAGGTNYAPRGLAMVGEEGPELINLRGGERIWPNGQGPALGGGGNVYHISGNLLTPEFWAQIQRMDAGAAQQGSKMAIRDLGYRQSRSLA